MLCEERDGMIVTCPRSFQDDARLKLSADGWDGGGPFLKRVCTQHREQQVSAEVSGCSRPTVRRRYTSDG